MALPVREHADEIAEAIQSAFLSLGVGGIGAAVGIAVFASRNAPAVCDTNTAAVGCRAIFLASASQYAHVAGKLALAAILVSAAVMVYDDLGGEE